MENLVIKGVECRLNENGMVELNLEHVARGLGFTQRQNKGGKEYESIRWERVRSYLQELKAVPTNGHENFPPLMGEGGLPEFIPENIFYKLCFKAENEIARGFQDLVTDEILPSIRKRGMYATCETLEKMISAPDFAIEILNALKEERRQKLEAQQQNEADKPRVLFAQAVETSQKSILVGELSKILKQNGIDMGQNRLFAWLRLSGYLCSTGERYNLPTQKSMELGLFEIKKTTITKPNGSILVTTTVKITGKGQIYFVNKFLTENV